MKKNYQTLLILFLFLGIGSYHLSAQPQMYSLTTGSSPSAGGYANPGGGMFYAGQNVTVTAIAVNGYTFSGWTGSVTSWTNPVTVTMNSNKTLIANFVKLYNLTVNTIPSNGGYVSGAGTGQFLAGQPITVTAIPVSGYRFVSWTGSVNSTSNPMTFTLNSNMAITANFELIPIEVKISSGWSHSFLLKSDGTLWAWGLNAYGQIGDGTTTNKYSPVQVGSGAIWKDVSGGQDFSLAIKSNGTLWAWGANYFGQLGDGTTIDKYSPEQIGYDANWSMVSAGSFYSLAIKTDGSLWAWGHNYCGELGNGTQTDSHSPIRIGTENNWVYISAGLESSMAIKSDGTLWNWGQNVGYQSAHDFIFTIPTKVGIDNDWKQVCVADYHALAIKNNGTLWAWGLNSKGQLGDGTTTKRYSPVRIGNDSDWASVSTYSQPNSSALKTNGTVWGWGENGRGEVGDGTKIQRLTPTQANGISDKRMISAGELFTLALGNDNSFCGTGYNYDGQLGDGSGILERSTFNCVSFPTSLKSTPSESNTQKSTIIDPSKSTIFQNYPNPTQGATTINYYLADDAVAAKIVLYNFTGSVVKEYPVYDKGKSSIAIDISNLPSGIYSYGLVVNGSNVDVKKLLLAK